MMVTIKYTVAIRAHIAGLVLDCFATVKAIEDENELDLDFETKKFLREQIFLYELNKYLVGV